MKTRLYSAVAALIPPGAAAQDAAAEEPRIQAPSCPYCGFAKNVAGSAGSENRGHEGHGGHDEHGHVAFGPHSWPDPALAVQQARNTRDGPAAADPDKAEPYQDNAAYAPRLDGPRDECASALPACRHDATAALHATFAHMAERYGFDAVPLSGMTCAGTASTAAMAHMVEYV